MDTTRSSKLPLLGTESQLPQMAQPCGPGEEQDPTQASNTGPLELLLDQVLAKIQVEKNAPAPLNQDGGPGGREHEAAQDSLFPLAEAGCMGIDAWKLTDSNTICRESQVPQVAQPSGIVQGQAPTQASSTDSLELFLDQLLTKVQVEEKAPGPLDLEYEWEQKENFPEMPLTQEEYQDVLEKL